MKTDKFKVIAGLLGFAVLGLVMMLLRESEGRVAAETKLNDLKYKMETVSNESQTLVMDLRGNIHDLEVKITDMADRHAEDLAVKAEEIRLLNERLDDAGKKYDSEVERSKSERQDLESRAAADAERLNLALKDKSQKLGELGDELEKASARYSKLLREKEAVEAKVISTDAEISSLKSELKKAQRENDRLKEEIAALAKKTEIIHD